jgi:hypothetical protein
MPIGPILLVELHDNDLLCRFLRTANAKAQIVLFDLIEEGKGARKDPNHEDPEHESLGFKNVF